MPQRPAGRREGKDAAVGGRHVDRRTGAVAGADGGHIEDVAESPGAESRVLSEAPVQREPAVGERPRLRR